MKGNFQFIILGVFIAAAVFGVLVFSGAIPIGKSSSTTAGTVTLWGTVPAFALTQPLEEFNNANSTFSVKYVQKSASTFDNDLLNALASGKGPDLLFLPDNLAYHYADKIYTIPYATFPLASFKNIFAGAGEVFLGGNGIKAFPMYIDPLVMYYSRSVLDANGIIYPPATWDDLTAMASKLTVKNDANQIQKSTVALGQYSNVAHAKDILSAMFMQAGNPIVAEQSGALASTLDSPTQGNYNLPSVLKFYTSFADPNDPAYSWNKSFPNSADAFSKEDLAFYFGYASELTSLQNRNPNQNFFVAPIPQIKSANFKLTGGHVVGIAVSPASKNFTTALSAASLLSTSDFAAKLAAALNVAPARRDLLAIKPPDAYSPIFYASALYAKSWLDPSPADTDNIFSGMVEAVLSNNLSISDAIRDASSKLSLLLVK